MIKAGMIMRKLPQYAADKFVTCKIIKNTEARFCNRKRMPDWLTPTVNHLVQTHINLIKKIEKYLPITDVAIEVNRFAFMQMENPNISGVNFQNGPLKGFDDVKAAIREQQHGKCLMCKNDIEHFHHIIPRSKGGSDTIQNQAGLCKKCHTKIHADVEFQAKLKDKKNGLIKKIWRTQRFESSCSVYLQRAHQDLRCRACTFLHWKRYIINQMHEVDAYCICLAAIGADKAKRPNFNNVFKIKQFRRQDRSIVNYQRERTYYLEGKKIATNRKPRFEQKGDALSGWYSEQVKLKDKKYADKLTGRITVKKSTRGYNSKNRVMPGTVFYYNGKRLVLTGQLTGGKYYRAYGDTKINYPVNKCQIYKHNEGLVFV